MHMNFLDSSWVVYSDGLGGELCDWFDILSLLICKNDSLMILFLLAAAGLSAGGLASDSLD